MFSELIIKNYRDLGNMRSFPLRLSSVNVTKFVENCGFGQIYLRNI